MSFFDGEVTAKEQLPGTIGSMIITVPVIPPTGTRGGFIGGRRLTDRILITVDGYILINLNLNRPVYMIIA
jgi:hypothetical protein